MFSALHMSVDLNFPNEKPPEIWNVKTNVELHIFQVVVSLLE